ncbi:hypothetical protein JVU11DRAFT_2847 [Chiua virens]|nr:hypothetical protein JVU11DRAFT_2847 [Chiua virens]
MPPPKKVDPPHKLVFATNSVRNTTFAVDNDKFCYEIVTRFWHPHLTKINKYDYENRVVTCVAEIESLPKKEVKVRFNTPDAEGEWMRASDFVRGDGTGVGGTFTVGDDDLMYRWKTHKRYLQSSGWLSGLGSKSSQEATAALEKIIGEYASWQQEFSTYASATPVSYLIVERRRRDAKIRIKLEPQ